MKPSKLDPEEVLVHVLKDDHTLFKVGCDDCIYDILYGQDQNTVTRNVSYKFDKNRLLLQWNPGFCDVKEEEEELYQLVPFAHSSPCPFSSSSSDEPPQEALPSEAIEVDVCVIVQTSDNHIVLLTKSEAVMTVNETWILPTSHLDIDETLAFAGNRTITESIGINLTNKEKRSLKILGLWESAVPVELEPVEIEEMVIPFNHYLVFYLHYKLDKPASKFGLNVIGPMLHPGKFNKCIWLPIEIIGAITKKSLELPEVYKKLSFISVTIDKGFGLGILVTSYNFLFANYTVNNETSTRNVFGPGSLFGLNIWYSILEKSPSGPHSLQQQLPVANED